MTQNSNPGAVATSRIKMTDMSAILDSLPQALLVVDGGFAVQYANSAAEILFGRSATQLARKGLEDLLPSDCPIFQLVKRVVEKNAPVNEYQVDVSAPWTGDGVIVDVQGAPMAESAGTCVLIFRERSIADRIARQRSPRSAARSVTGLAAMLAHEIKNPLSGIRGAAQLLEASVDEADGELAQLITRETDRVVNIVDRMEVFSDDTPFKTGPVNMHSVLGQVRRVASAGFARDIRFEELYDPSIPAVAGSQDALVQVILNLVKNASEALKDMPRPKITLSSAYRPGFSVRLTGGGGRIAELPLEFTVSDNGSGIPDEIINDIFDPFVTSKTNGSGLGLALVAKIMSKHGGVVECDTSRGGTRFRLLLPAWKRDTQRQSGIEETQDMSEPASKTGQGA